MNALEPVRYHDGATALTGHLARPAGGARGAVLILPTIANLTPAVERRAAMLADLGFVTMIADFYGIDSPGFEGARPLAEALRADVDGYRARISAGIVALRAEADGLPLAAIGYCMGGQAALEAARAGEDLRLVASFHGLLDSRRPADGTTPIAPRVLVCHGDADPMVPRDKVLAFWAEMDTARANWHFHAYSGVRHGFTDPASDARGLDAVRYDASADRQSWAALTGLLDEIFGT